MLSVQRLTEGQFLCTQLILQKKNILSERLMEILSGVFGNVQQKSPL